MNVRITFIPGWAAAEEIWSPLIRHLPAEFKTKTCSWTGLLDAPHQCLPDSRGESSGQKRNVPSEACETKPSHSGPHNEKQFLAGWSLGSLLALQAAARRPDRIAGLILISATSRFTHDKGYEGTARSRIRAMQKMLVQNRGLLLQGFYRSALAPSRKSPTIDMPALLKQAETIETEELAKGLDYLIHTDLREILAEITIPVLLLHGAGDAVIPLSSARYLAHHLRFSTLVSFPEEGHMLPLHRPRETAEQIRAFCYDCYSGNKNSKR